MNDSVLLRFARFFAATRHGDQQYSGGLPYTHHLAAVEAVVRRFGTHYVALYRDGAEQAEALYCAAWLHDVVEDTPTKLKEIAENFGERVALLVGAVTNEPGANRKIRAALTYPKILAAGPSAVRLKLADRIANMEAGGRQLKIYQDEYVGFRRNLYTAGKNEDMWARLDQLAKEQDVDAT